MLAGVAGAQPVRIGVLAPGDDARAGEAASLRRGAAMAVADANAEGGYRGRPFELVLRSVEGAWGTGSDQIVRLVFDDGVVAVLGGLEGREAHLIEQAITKRRVVFLSPWASDPTLTQAFVPWMFRLAPDDHQLAHALLDAIPEGARIATVRDDGYDARMAASAFSDVAADRGREIQARLTPDDAVAGLSDHPVEALVLFTDPTGARKLLRELAGTGRKPHLFGVHALADDAVREAAAAAGFAVTVPALFEPAVSPAFAQRYRDRFGAAPDLLAAYTYDGVRAVVEAVRTAGADREHIRDALSALDRDGVTGRLRFDEHGNRIF